MKTSAMIRYGSLDTKGPNRKDKVFYIVFETEEEAQEMVNLLDELRASEKTKRCKTCGGTGFDPNRSTCLTHYVPDVPCPDCRQKGYKNSHSGA